MRQAQLSCMSKSQSDLIPIPYPVLQTWSDGEVSSKSNACQLSVEHNILLLKWKVPQAGCGFLEEYTYLFSCYVCYSRHCTLWYSLKEHKISFRMSVTTLCIIYSPLACSIQNLSVSAKIPLAFPWFCKFFPPPLPHPPPLPLPPPPCSFSYILPNPCQDHFLLILH